MAHAGPAPPVPPLDNLVGCVPGILGALVSAAATSSYVVNLWAPPSAPSAPSVALGARLTFSQISQHALGVPQIQETTRKTFAQVLLESSLRPKIFFPAKTPGFTDKGEPAIFFSEEEIKISCEFLKFAVIAKCSYGRPSIPEIRVSMLQKFQFQSNCVISRLNARHVLIRLHCEADLLKVLIQKSIYIKGFLFRFFRWSHDFQYDSDPSTIPAWIGFPDLPVNFFHEDLLRSIAGNIGCVLRIHEATLAMTDTSEALVCIDLDLTLARKERIWIGSVEGGYWQKINYHRVPHLCASCHKIGHLESHCKKKERVKVVHSQSNCQVFRPRAFAVIKEDNTDQNAFSPVVDLAEPSVSENINMKDQDDCGDKFVPANQLVAPAVMDTDEALGSLPGGSATSPPLVDSDTRSLLKGKMAVVVCGDSCVNVSQTITEEMRERQMDNVALVSEHVEAVQSDILSASPAAIASSVNVAEDRLACFSALRAMSAELNVLWNRHSTRSVDVNLSSPLSMSHGACNEATLASDAPSLIVGVTGCGVGNPTGALQQDPSDDAPNQMDGEVVEVPFQLVGRSKRRNRRKPKYLEPFDIKI